MWISKPSCQGSILTGNIARVPLQAPCWTSRLSSVHLVLPVLVPITRQVLEHACCHAFQRIRQVERCWGCLSCRMIRTCVCTGLRVSIQSCRRVMMVYPISCIQMSRNSPAITLQSPTDRYMYHGSKEKLRSLQNTWGRNSSSSLKH